MAFTNNHCSGDYGPNFLGHVLGAATYLVNHPIFGYISFGGNVNTSNSSTVVAVQPKDAVRQRIFVAPVSLYITIDAGIIEDFSYDTVSKEVVISISGGRSGTSTTSACGSEGVMRTVLKWEQTGGGGDVTKMELQSSLDKGLGGILVNLSSTDATSVVFAAC